MSQGKKAEFQVFQQGFSFQFENCVIVWRLRHVPLILERYETALTEFPHLFSAALLQYPATHYNSRIFLYSIPEIMLKASHDHTWSESSGIRVFFVIIYNVYECSLSARATSL